jgi:hypothetical protein
MLALHWHHLLSLHRTIRFHHQYCSQSRSPTYRRRDRERRVQKSTNSAEQKPTHVRIQCTTPYPYLTHSYRKMRRSTDRAHAGEIRVFGRLTNTSRRYPHCHERWRKSRSRKHADDEEESYGAHADEEPLARSRVRTKGLVNVDTPRRDCSHGRFVAILDRGQRRMST